MALVVKDRVQEYSTTSGTGTLTLSGAAPGYQSFSSSIGNGNTTFYTIYDGIAQTWEVGVGTVAAGTLARTTVLSNSLGTTAKINLAGNQASVFCTYPAEQSVNLDASNNVSPLGTIASGTWQATTVGVAYGGTGVTTSSGVNSVALRDANANITANNFLAGYNSVTASGGTTVLTAASAYYQRLGGSTTQTFQLPDATTCVLGQAWVFDNDSSGTLTIVDNSSATVDTIPSGGYGYFFAESISTSAGSWGKYALLPANYDFNTTTANFGSATITNATWNGATITSAYGGTGLTTFTAANNAIYSTAANTLSAGTLPVAAGGTGAVTLTGYVYGNGTGAFTASTTIPTSALTGNYVSTFSGGSTGLTPSTATTGAVTLGGLLATGYGGTGLTTFTSGGAVYATSTSALTTGTLPIASGGTGQTTATTAFNALSPITTKGDLISSNGTNNVRLGVGTDAYVLVADSTATTGLKWAANSSGTTITKTDFTATASQTTFTVAYTVGLVEVYVNGVKLGIADYTATNGTSVILATGANVGDLVEVVAYTTLNTITTIASELFSGTGSQTVYTMAYNPASTASVIIAISGVVQDPSTYTVSTNTLTFSTAPPSGTNNISVRYLGLPSSIGITSFSAGTTGLTPSTATTGPVTLGGTLNVANGGTGVTTSTGSGNNVLSASPTFTGTVVAPTINAGAATALTLQSAGTTAVTIDTSQNVGIGTTSPDTKFQVSGTSGSAQFQAGTDVNGYFQVNAYDTNPVYCVVGGTNPTAGVFGTQANIPTVFFTNNTERMRIDSSGNVGIGTSSPATKLDVNGSSSSGIILQQLTNTSTANVTTKFTSLSFRGTDTVGTGKDAAYITCYPVESNFINSYLTFNIRTSDTNPTEKMRIDNSGNVLVGTTSTSGSSTNTAQIVGGVFTTASGTTSAANNTATTIFTCPALPNGVYIVNAQLANNAPASYMAVALISVGNTTLRTTALATATSMTITVSGQNIQATQTSGSSQTITWTITRFA